MFLNSTTPQGCLLLPPLHLAVARPQAAGAAPCSTPHPPPPRRFAAAAAYGYTSLQQCTAMPPAARGPASVRRGLQYDRRCFGLGLRSETSGRAGRGWVVPRRGWRAECDGKGLIFRRVWGGGGAPGGFRETGLARDVGMVRWGAWQSNAPSRARSPGA